MVMVCKQSSLCDRRVKQFQRLVNPRMLVFVLLANAQEKLAARDPKRTPGTG